MAAGLATRARLHPVPRRPRGTRPTYFLNQDRKGSFFLRVFAVMAQLSRASRGRYRAVAGSAWKKDHTAALDGVIDASEHIGNRSYPEQGSGETRW
jgi:hypothetical protein